MMMMISLLLAINTAGLVPRGNECFAGHTTFIPFPPNMPLPMPRGARATVLSEGAPCDWIALDLKAKQFVLLPLLHNIGSHNVTVAFAGSPETPPLTLLVTVKDAGVMPLPFLSSAAFSMCRVRGGCGGAERADADERGAWPRPDGEETLQPCGVSICAA